MEKHEYLPKLLVYPVFIQTHVYSEAGQYSENI